MGRGKRTAKTTKRSWFNKGVEALQRTVPNAPPCYGCPLCLRGFPEQKIDLLTSEHVPPASLGGHRLVLTCKDCNWRAGGRTGVDTHARRAEDCLDFVLGTMEGPRSAEFSVGSLKQKVEVVHGPGHFLVLGLPQSNPPEVTRQIQDAMEMIGQEHSFKLSLTKNRYSPQRERISWLRAAYLAAFAALGYRYILRSILDPVRQQILDPDKEVIHTFKLDDAVAPSDRRFIVFVSKPDWVRGLAVAMGRYIVLLPVDTDDTNFYERLKSNTTAGLKAELSGQLQLTWPRGPVFARDFAP